MNIPGASNPGNKPFLQLRGLPETEVRGEPQTKKPSIRNDSDDDSDDSDDSDDDSDDSDDDSDDDDDDSDDDPDSLKEMFDTLEDFDRPNFGPLANGEPLPTIIYYYPFNYITDGKSVVKLIKVKLDNNNSKFIAAEPGQEKLLKPLLESFNKEYLIKKNNTGGKTRSQTKKKRRLVTKPRRRVIKPRRQTMKKRRQTIKKRRRNIKRHRKTKSRT